MKSCAAADRKRRCGGLSRRVLHKPTTISTPTASDRSIAEICSPPSQSTGFIKEASTYWGMICNFCQASIFWLLQQWKCCCAYAASFNFWLRLCSYCSPSTGDGIQVQHDLPHFAISDWGLIHDVTMLGLAVTILQQIPIIFVAARICNLCCC
jgi:hypothetical protein